MSMDFLWCEQYRPKTISECILPKDVKEKLSNIIVTGSVPNLLLTGTAGLGKTTAARAICEQLDLDYIVINASEDGNIDTLRSKIRKFASSISLSGGKKVVILDEADYLNAQSTQPALRGFIENFSDNCRFILTCNFKNRLMEPLHSRCTVVEFNTTRTELAEMCGQFFVRMKDILKKEGVEYNDKFIADLIMRHAPDWRRAINECQSMSINGLISDDNRLTGTDYNTLFNSLKEKDFKSMRKWVVENIDVDATAIFRNIYDMMYEKVEAKSIPQLVVILAEYQYKQAFVADGELNVVACMTEIMANIEVK